MEPFEGGMGAFGEVEVSRWAVDATRRYDEYRVFLDSLPVGFFTLDGDWHLGVVNRPAAQIVGCAPGEVQGRVIFDVVPGLEGTRWHAAARRVMESRRPETVMLRYPFRDNGARDYEVRIYPIPDGLCIVMIAVSEERRVELSHLRLSQVFLGAADPMVIEDLYGYIVDVNDETVRVHGWERHELLGQPVDMLIPPEWHASARELRARCRRGEEVRNVEALRWTREKERRVFLTTMSLLTENDEVVGMASIAKDVTDLRQTQQRMELAVKATRDGLWDYDFARDSLWLSDRCRELAGLSSDEEAMSWDAAIRHIHPDDRQRVVDSISTAIEGDAERWSAEFRFRLPGGEWGWAFDRAMIARDASGRATRVIGAISDETERRRAECELREAEERQRAILDAAVDAIVFCDDRGVIEWLNPAVARIFGAFPEDLVGQGLSALLVMPERSGRETAPVPREWLSTSGIGHACTGRHASGTEFPVSVAAAEIRLNGRPNVCLFIRDMTEHHIVREQLQQAQKMEAIGTLASGVAHDFNNLLMGVSGCANIARRSLPEDSPAVPYLDEIKRAAMSGEAITRQLLDVGRQREAESAIVDLNGVINETAMIFGRLLGEDIEIALHLDARDARVPVTDGRLEQLLLNLAVNARDAMPDGGRLTIATRLESLDEETIEPHHGELPPGVYVVLTVQDTGVGMSDEVRQRIFEPFFSTKEKGRGSGLGLATVYGIVRQAGGHVKVSSTVGKGTRFDIFLPFSYRLEQTAGAEESAVGEQEPKKTVLLIEDEYLVRLTVRHYLESAGYEVLVAENAWEALEHGRRHAGSIDLVLTDMVLPGQSGVSVVSELHRARPELRAIFMSAHAQDWLVEHEQAAAGIDFLHKPFTEAELLGLVEDVLSRDELGPPLESRPRPG